PPGIASSQYGTVATALVINVVLGGALWASSAISRKNLMNGAIVAAVISLVLIYYGGQSGQIGGVVGIFGAILAAAKPYLPPSRRPSDLPPGIASSQYGTVATALVINVVLGGALWVSSAISRKNLMNGAIVAAVIRLVLVYYGGTAGQIGGVVGILGAILAAA